MSRYRVAPQAREDIKEIYRYIKAENPSAAKRVRDRLYEKCRLLAAQPYVGWMHPELPAEFRCTTAGNLVIVYRPRDNGVDIVHIVHSARDVEALLPGDE